MPSRSRTGTGRSRDEWRPAVSGNKTYDELRRRPASARMPPCDSAGGGGFTAQGDDMGKYALAWLLGVPGIVLVGIYLFTHL